MKVSISALFLITGYLLCGIGTFLTIPLFTEIIYKTDSVHIYLIPVVIYLIIGGSIVITQKDSDLNIDLRTAFFVTVFSWIFVCIISSVPFIYSKTNLTPIDAIFESMSGITTTGSTIINNLDMQPKGILIWRSFLQWLGGIGIIVLAIAILPFLKVGGMQLFHMEGDDPYEKFLPKLSSVVLRIFTFISLIKEKISFSLLTCLRAERFNT